MECRKCKKKSVKNGRVKSNGKQRFYCKECRESFVEEYSNYGCELGINDVIVNLLKEGCGTNSISRLLKISKTSVTRKILKIASSIKRPPILLGREYEVGAYATASATA